MDQEHAEFRAARLGLNEFNEKLNTTVCMLDCTSAVREPRFSITFEHLHLGALDVLRYDSYGFKAGRRGFRHIREDKIDDVLLILPLTTPVGISQKGRAIVLNPNEGTLVSTLQPFEGICCTPLASRFSELVVRIPGPLLRQRVAHADLCCVNPIKMDSGSGKVLRAFLDNLVEEHHDFSATQGERFGKMLVEAVANIAPHACDMLKSGAALYQSPRSRIFGRATEFIDSKLSDPALTPALIAHHFRISVSYLHAIFAASSQSVSGYIREARLQRCREALRDPLLHHQSIIEIAMRWGFNSASSFNHAYRRRFNSSPSEDRIPLSATC